MVAWLLSMIAGKAGLIVAGIVGAVGVLGTLMGYARKAGKDAQKVEEAKARDANLEAIKRAAAARPAGSVSDDPHNLDK